MSYLKMMMKKKKIQILKILSGLLFSVCIVFTLVACNKTEKSNNNNNSSDQIAPKLISVENTGGGVSITWEGIDGVNNYRVYRKTEKDNWGRLQDVVRTSFIDTSTEWVTKQ